MTNKSPDPYNAYQLTVRGRVQGVGFRFFTRSIAEKLAVSGWVRNTPTGNVKIFVQGKQNNRQRIYQTHKKRATECPCQRS